MSVPIITPRRLTSIIIPCFNQLTYTQLCIAALARNTQGAWELIVVDNGSSDGTAAYLAGVRDVAPFSVTIVTNTENRGFPVACNQGLAASRGEYLVLLNNDTVVIQGWLDQLIALADSDPAIGMTGPVSNYASPPQLVQDVPYDGLGEMHNFAARWRQDHRRQWFKTAKLSGFCLLMKRHVFEAVGKLDEQFGLGFFDDDDLSLRVRKAGFDLAVAFDLFVHHFGSRTIAGSGIDSAALLAKNRAKFESKWGTEAPAVCEVLLKPLVEVSTPHRRIRVSLTMIVRNEEQNLTECLKSAADMFDEIVIVDTGSTDRTVEIARSFGARVFDFTWIDDFAAARNCALSHATGDYAFWLDADDRIEPIQRDRLMSLLKGLRLATTAYVVRCACDADPDGNGGTVVDHVRLFPVHKDVRWEYRVHEQILPALRRVGVNIRWSDVVVRHVGYNDPVLRRKKLERDQAILETELAEKPDDPFVLFNLGQIAREFSDLSGALEYLKRSLARSTPAHTITRKLHALIARCHQQLGDSEAALTACGEGLANDPDDAELLFRKGILHRLRDELTEAEVCWRRILTLRRPEHFASVDEGIYGHLTRRNLATLAESRGDLVEASQLWSAVLAERPRDEKATQSLHRIKSITNTI